MLRKLLIIMLALFTAMPFVVKADEEERIVLKQEEYIINGMGAFLIEYELYPETLKEGDLQVFISDKQVLGMIGTGSRSHKFFTMKPGTAEVTLTAPNGASATAKVTVNDVVAESIAFPEPESTVGVNNLAELFLVSTPEYGFLYDSTVVVSDESILKCEGSYNGKVLLSGLKEGDCTITVSAKNGRGEILTAETIVHCVFKPVEGITVPVTEYTGRPGSKLLTFHLYPMDTSEKTVTLTSSNPDVVRVPETTNDREIRMTLLKAGEAVITITAANGATGTIHVTVKEEVEEVTNLRWSKSSIDVPLGGASAGGLMVIPNTGSLEGIVFTSSDEEVAKVIQQIRTIVLVEGYKEGTAEITATLPNGLSTVLTVNVVYVEPEEIVDLEEEVTLEGKGQRKTIEFSGRPAGYAPAGLSISSDNPEVAEVWLEQYRLWVKSGNPGTANVTITLPNGNTYSSKVTVTEVKAEEIAFDEEGPITVMEDEIGTAAYTYGPENANSPITVTVEDPSIAEITLENDGSVSFKGLKTGTTTLTVAADENVKDTITIVVEENPDKDPAACTVFGFCEYEGKMYWYEEGKRQGVYGDEKNITDIQFGIERGREIYDPDTDAWYWLDAVNDGAAAYDKEVWIPYIFQEETPGSTEGKWVRYDDHGQMVKGWYTCDAGVYYYDKLTGAMYKGEHEIEGKTYFFDELTGIRQ